MNSTKIAEKFFKCSIPPHSSNRGWAHNSGQLEYCKIKFIICQTEKSIERTYYIYVDCKNDLIRDIDNYIYDIIDYENLICMYFWLICLFLLLYINKYIIVYTF